MKGIENALVSFDALVNAWSNQHVKLYIVGSVKEGDEKSEKYFKNIKALSKCHENEIIIRDEYVSDNDFDMWICASDLVIAPYLQSCSSAVIARANMYEKPVMVADVGGLKDQMMEGVDTSGCYAYKDIMEMIVKMNEVVKSYDG